MSYILDALKKSDQERQQNTAPTLQTVQRQPHGQAHSVNKTLTVLLLLLLIVIAAGGYFFFIERESAKTTTPLLAPTEAKPLEPKNKAIEDTHDSVAKNSPTEQSGTSLAAKSSKSKPPVVELWELPDTVQQALPALTFSFHVYSDNPERRTIIINKRRVKEGDSVANGLTLEEITPQGLVLDWQSTHRFSINVVDNW